MKRCRSGQAGCASHDENSRKRLVIEQTGRLHAGVHRIAPVRDDFGDVVLTGAYKGLAFFMYHSKPTLPVELNRMSAEVYGLDVVEGQSTSAWARHFVERMVACMPVRYGSAWTDEEYEAKNMVNDETGVYAIGADVNHEIPGLYWLNYFGGPYVELIGRERLLSAPAYEVKPVGDGVLIALDASAESWQNEAYVEREQAVIAHLGKQYFFSRHDPDRQTIAPDFRDYDRRHSS